MAPIETISRHCCHGGVLGYFKHASVRNDCEMRFAVYTPPQASERRVPVLYYLAGLTCTEETFVMSTRHQQLNQLCLDFLDAFNRNDLDAVMAFFHPDAVYEELHGRVNRGVAAIREAFAPQFSGKFGTMSFIEDDTFIDAEAGKIMSSWDLHLTFDGKPQVLRGLDLLEFAGDKIVRKQTFCKAKAPLYQAQA